MVSKSCLGAFEVRSFLGPLTSAPGPRVLRVNRMSQSTDKRHALNGAHLARLAVALERQGDVALAQQLHVSRQTLARAVAGMRLNSNSRSVLESYLASVVAA